MKRAVLLLAMVLGFSIGAKAQIATISGNLKDLGVNNATQQNTYVLFTLQNYGANIPRVVGTNAIVSPNSPPFKPDANGNISGSIQENSSISPVNTFYKVCVYYQGSVFRCNNFFINANFNLNNAVPITSVVPPPVNLAPTNDVFAGPASGPMNTPSFRPLVGADLPPPSLSSLGGVESIDCSTFPGHIQKIQVTGVPVCSADSGGGGGGTPSAPNRSLQFNNSGSFGGAPGLTTPDGTSLDIKGPVPWIDATTYGVRVLNKNSLSTITVTTTASSASVSTTGISDFQVNDGIAIPAAGNATTQSTPSAPMVTSLGTSGSTTYSYECVGVDKNWGLTAASAAGSTSTGPTVFGQGAVGITSISRTANVVTVTASSTMPFSSGTFHAVIANITGGTTPFSGLQLVTVTSGTTLTYSQTGANESGTTGASSYILFTNAFILTTVQATAGSPNLVLTTDVNHNITVGTTARPTKIFLDGINFAGSTPPFYADGLYTVSSVTSNTITVVTSITAATTTTGTASSLAATSGIAQMTATVWALIDVTCPAISSPTVYYAVYGNYGSGYAPVGFTPWEENIFEDYGPINSQTGFTAPATMSLPATPPGAAQKQVFAGQIQAINGSTLTLTANVPSAVTSVTASHDNGVPFLNAVNAACANGAGGFNDQSFSPVYLPRQLQVGGVAGTSQYIFNAPVDLPASSCTSVKVLQGAPVVLNGTMMGHNGVSGLVLFEWSSPPGLSGIGGSAGGTGSYQAIGGVASPQMVTTTTFSSVKGISFVTGSNGQIGLVDLGNVPHTLENLAFGTNGHALTAIPFLIENINFSLGLHNISFGGDSLIEYPFARVGNVGVGQVAWWPVPVIEIIGPQFPPIKWDGQNYGLNGGGESRGIQIDKLYGNSSGPMSFDLSYVYTFQDPWQPLVTFYGAGGAIAAVVNIEHIGMDSVTQPPIACVAGVACAQLYRGNAVEANGDGSDPTLTGPAFLSAFETLTHSAAPVQNTNECSINGTLGVNIPLSCTNSSLTNAALINPTTTGTDSGVETLTNKTIGDKIICAETTAPAGSPGNDLIWCDSASHLPKVNPNNVGNQTFSRYTITPINGDCVTWSGTTGLLGDAGAACGAGAGGMNTDMSNMANPTHMSQSLTPNAVNTIAVGSQTLPFTNIFLGTVANQAGSFDTTALTANHVIKFPNADATAVQNCPSIANQFLTQILQASGACAQAQPTLANIAAGASPAGLFDFTASTMEIPEAAGFTTNVNSTIGLDTTANAVHLWINNADALTAGFTSAPAGSKCAQTSGTVGLLTEAAGVCGTTTPSTTDTFTNKTFNAESTGNSLSEPVRAYFEAAGCNNTTAANGLDIGVVNGPTPQCVGSTVRKGILQFARGNVAYINWHLPNDWNSGAATDIEIGFTTTDTTNGHVTSFNIQTACNKVDGTATDDPALNALQALSVTTGASQISGGELTGRLTSITMTGCVADYNFEIAITRNNSGTDTNTDTAVAVKFAEVTIGVTKNAANR